jgi:thiosulfate dehydrogenase [quinone] large subunit
MTTGLRSRSEKEGSHMVNVKHNDRVIEDPKIVQWLLRDARAGWLWLPFRLWLGWQWIQASEHKLVDPAWMKTGTAIQDYWTRAVAIPDTGRPAITFDWYRSFLQALLDANAHTWFAPMVAYGELLVGVALLIGAFTGIAALFGATMNWNFMMAGSASSNPVLLIIAVGLIMAWKVSGYIGADYFLLPWLGTPWGRKEPKDMAVPAAGQPAA